MPVYDFSKPEDVAVYLQSLQKPNARLWWVYFKKQKGDEFMKKVYKIVKSSNT